MNKVPSVSGFLAWSRERFPPVTLVSGYLLYALAASLVRRELDGQATWQPMDFLFGLGLVLHLLVLRVLDEHKDFEFDRVTHPERVLQRGLITLPQLKMVGVLAALGTLALTIFVGTVECYVAWALMAAWTALMTVEFFCGAWLRRRLFLYSASHIMIVGFMVAWGATLAHPMALQTSILPWLIVLTPVNGLIFEVLRKTKGADEEIDGVESFSRLWGPKRAATMGLALHVISFGLVSSMSQSRFAASAWAYLPLILAVTISAMSLKRYIQNPVAKQRKANEGAGALYSLVAYVTLIVFAVTK